MRRAALVVTAMMLAACKGKDITAPSTKGTLNFQIETKTCSTQGTFDIKLFIDHVLVDTPHFSVGSTASYAVDAGSHIVGGSAVDGRFNWASVVVQVPAGGQYTALFGCQ